jgi:hypothetical protein
MASEVSSILLGTSGLILAAVVALAITRSRSPVASHQVRRVRRIAGLGVLLQAGHFAEEYLHQFHLRFPVLFDLAPWSESFFLAFNLTWIAVWGLAIAGLGRLPRVAAFPLWFLAIASAANGVAHPLLSLAVSGYFPGLWSSPFVGILGVVLLRALVSATDGRREVQDIV